MSSLFENEITAMTNSIITQVKSKDSDYINKKFEHELMSLQKVINVSFQAIKKTKTDGLEFQRESYDRMAFKSNQSLGKQSKEGWEIKDQSNSIKAMRPQKPTS